MKECICCYLKKPLTDFEFRKDTKQYRNKCKKCRHIQLLPIVYCCIDCGNKISKPTALRGNGRCISCASIFKVKNSSYPNTLNHKYCVNCHEYKHLECFHKDKNRKDGYFPYCKICMRKNKKQYKNLYPWKDTLLHIKQRCNNPKKDNYKWYGGRGIKCLITEEELKDLWFRDKAYEMERPSIDRIDNDGNYTYANCKYIEQNKNSAKQWIDRRK
jgi:hypothetical protein